MVCEHPPDKRQAVGSNPTATTMSQWRKVDVLHSKRRVSVGSRPTWDTIYKGYMSSAYKLKPYYGNLPLWDKGVNVGRLNRADIADTYGFSRKEVDKAYLNWMEVFRIDGSTLTFEQYLDKLHFQSLRPSDIGISSEKFNLSRYNDHGPYTNESCRFITRRENVLEQTNLFGL